MGCWLFTILTYLTPKTNPFTAVFKTKAHIFLGMRSHFAALSILLQEGSYFQYFPNIKVVLLGEKEKPYSCIPSCSRSPYAIE